MTEKVVITAYNTDEDVPLTKAEIMDALDSLELSDIYIKITGETDDEGD